MTESRWSRRYRIVIVVALAVGVALAGYYGAGRLTSSSHGPRGDGPTFYAALAAVNATIAQQGGGPWDLFSLVGIAAQAPFSPDANGYAYVGPGFIAAACDRVFGGVTLWNGSIPVFTGSFDSGTAPFWQFAFYSSASDEVLVATDVAGIGRVYPPIAASNQCVETWHDFAANPRAWVPQIVENGSVTVDTPQAAQVVWNNVDTSTIQKYAPLAEIYTSGPAIFSDTQDLPWGIMGVDFFGCGVQGVMGNRVALFASGANRNGTFAGDLFGETNCAGITVPLEPGSTTTVLYTLNYTSEAGISSNATRWSEYSIKLNMVDSAGFYMNNNGWGIANWMVSLNLTSPAGTDLPVGAPGCTVWVPSFTDCVSNGKGWYAILLSATGEWQSSYGAVGGGANWTGPLTAVMTDEELVIVTPLSWTVAGAGLQFGSTTPWIALNGTLPLE